eukprot:13270_1
MVYFKYQLHPHKMIIMIYWVVIQIIIIIINSTIICCYKNVIVVVDMVVLKGAANTPKHTHKQLNNHSIHPIPYRNQQTLHNDCNNGKHSQIQSQSITSSLQSNSLVHLQSVKC